MASLVISVMPIAGALYETNTNDEGIYVSNLQPGTYTITAIAFAPKWVPGDAKLMGEINVTLKKGENLKGKDITVEMNKKLNTIPVDVEEGRGLISGKILLYEPFFKKIMPVPSKLCETKVVITKYEDNLRII
jgi:hypothetical protein